MKSIYSYFFKNEDEKKVEIDDPIAKYIPEDQQEQLVCFVLTDCTLYNLKPKANKQLKECEFINCSLSLGTKQIDTSDTQKSNIPIIRITNDDYDEDQDQKPEECLPITEELMFMKYTDGADHIDEECKNEVWGFVFFYPQLNLCKILETEITSEEVRRDIEQFEQWLCKILFVVNEQTPISLSKSREIQQKQAARQKMHCFKVSLALLLKQVKINDIFEQPKTQRSEDPKIAKRQDLKENQKILSKATKETRSEMMAEHMSNLRVGQEDLREMADLQINVEERLIQIMGNFYKWDPVLSQNLLIKEDLFFSIDRISEESKQNNLGGRYIINVFDQTGQVSYTTCEIKQDNQIQLDSKARIIMWIGQQRLSGEVPAWSFAVKQDGMLDPVRNVLSKVIFETKTRALSSQVSAPSEEDQNWLNAAVIAEDAEMLDISQITFGGLEEDSNASQTDYDDFGANEDQEFSELEQLENEEALKDEDLEPEMRDAQNRELIQVLEYDRAFCVKGPVIKIYKNQESKEGPHQRLEYLMHLPLLQDSKNNLLHPENLVLHNNETKLMFTDKGSQKMINFDLETGQIIDEIPYQDDLVQDKQLKICNERKNSQIDPSQIFQAISAKSMFTIDTRLDSKTKVAAERVYKKSPNFNTIATSQTGGLAIGSTDGTIRLYKQVGQDAKTLLPGLSDAIISIEVSRDGQWVLATTKGYILIIPTLCENGKTGFEHRMGKEKPNPKKLQLKPADIAKYSISEISFRPAKFNNFTSDGEESSIVTSTGQFLITWNFRHIKKGVLNKYKIQQLQTRPVDSQFQVNNDEKIIVTDDQTIGFQTRNKKVSFQY